MRIATRACLAAAATATLAVASAKADVQVGVAVPLTGPYAWIGENTRQGAVKAIENANERGGVLGQALEPILVDDYCDPGQAMAAAEKLVAADVPFVVGNPCSGAAIPASTVYEDAGVVFISPGATNPGLTERGLGHVFRVVGRDDQQGAVAGNYLADSWAGAQIAIVHDGQTYGEGVAAEVRRRLRERGVSEALYEAITPGQTDFIDLVRRMHDADIDVVFFGGYMAEGGLLIRQASERLPDVRFVVPDGVQGDDFPLIAGPAAEGVLMTSFPEARENPAASSVVAGFRAAGFEPTAGTLEAYAAVQVWTQAVEQAGTLEAENVAEALRTHEFDTVLGTIGFDAKGDVTGYETFTWYIWKDGEYAPLAEPRPND